MAYNDDEFAAFIEEMEEDEDEDEEDDSYLVMLNVLYLRLKDKSSIKYKHIKYSLMYWFCIEIISWEPVKVLN